MINLLQKTLTHIEERKFQKSSCRKDFSERFVKNKERKTDITKKLSHCNCEFLLKRDSRFFAKKVKIDLPQLKSVKF